MAPRTSFQPSSKRKYDSDINCSKMKLHKASCDEESEDNMKYELLSYQSIMEGMLILGCIVEIREHYFICSLPGCLTGKVPVTNISDKCSEILKDENSTAQAEKPFLQSIIKLGMVIPCKVMSITAAKFGRIPDVILSINPQDVNGNLKSSSFYSNMILYASIRSVEDHGYVLDVGVPGFQGFIRSYVDDEEKLSLGEVVPVIVKKTPKASFNVLQLSKLRLDETYPMIEEENIKLSSILPGSCINAYVTEVKHPFVIMTYQNFNVCASGLSLKNPEKLLSDEVLCKVLYIHPVTHVIYVCFGTTPTPKTFSSYFGFKKYDLVPKVKFQFWHCNQGYCRIRKSCFGFFQKRDMKENRSTSYEELKVETEIPMARVLAFHYMDNLVELTIKESWINQKIVYPEEIQIGNVFQGTVRKHLPFGMFVRICPGFTGYVKHIHMSDVHVTKPEKLFPVGIKVNCKVVALIPNRKPYFTCKESLLSLPSSAMLSSYEDASKGMLVTGVVKSIENHCVYVLFFQNIQGKLPMESLPKECVLFIGQTISCEIDFCDPEKKRLKLSLKNVGFQSSDNCRGLVNLNKGSKTLKKEKIIAKQDSSVDCQFEEDIPCKALIKGVTSNQINLLLPGKVHGRVHITELGCTEEGVSPLKTYSKDEHIDVYVIGNFLKKCCNYLEISHRNMVKFYECSLSSPPPISLTEHFEIGMPLLGFVNKVDDFCSTLWLSPYQTGKLEHINFAECPKTLRKLKKNLRKGVSVFASVLEVEDSDDGKSSSKRVVLTKIGSTLPEVGSNIVGMIQVACPKKNIVVKLPNGYYGSIDLTDTQDVYTPLDFFFAKLKKLKYVLCHVLDVNHDTKFCSLSLRKSRLYKQHPINADTFCPEITIDNIGIGSSAKGFVKSVSNSNLLINFGRMLDGKIELHKCTHECSECKYSKNLIKKYPVGSIIDVIIGELDTDNEFYSLSEIKPTSLKNKSVNLPWDEDM
ncbi:uncharacterized protein LOC129218136 isoform X2 [Uloborus diversus]|uniref:uncharacterized protein LOC129218136 isoform X2 n=1 Tax=Uloborus diversus TaxID=327109 RepID=UPI00240945B8|nr:uncharacterized protein LOC129218136 isoform X2 [Uloborus diversus]